LERAGISGYVVLRYIVMEDGSVYQPSIQVVERSDHRFEEAARRISAGAGFEPGELNGRRARVWVKQKVTFTNHSPMQ
jgi:TonB family protein